MAAAPQAVYADDYFSAYLYTGDGTTSKTVQTGVNLSAGGMVWIKNRGAAQSHILSDGTLALNSDTTGVASASPVNLGGSGFTLNTSAATVNAAGANYVAWSFRKAAKFFDMQTKAHVNGVANTVDLSVLGTVGCVLVRRIDNGGGDWFVWHRSLSAGDLLYLNRGDAKTIDSSISVTSATLTISASLPTGTYIIYAFAHDTDLDGVVQCGAIATSLTSVTDVPLPWEPQFVIIKDVTSGGAWRLHDTARGWDRSAADALLIANQSSVEAAQTIGHPKADGFQLDYGSGSSSYGLIYIAIRRPNRPPSTGAEVFKAVARTGTGAAADITGVGFAPDVALYRARTPAGVAAAANMTLCTRLRGAGFITQVVSAAEQTNTVGLLEFKQDGVSVGADTALVTINKSALSYINYFFRRATGFMDEVLDVGTAAAHAIPHGLGVVPELIIRKKRAGGQWHVWHSTFAMTEEILLDSAAPKVANASIWNGTAPTSTNFYVGAGAGGYNDSGELFDTLLFATLPGVSKVGKYTGNGGSLTINCGFAAGARFVLIKAITNTFDWCVWDTTRGITSSADPVIYPNNNSAEYSAANTMGADSSGFTVINDAVVRANEAGIEYIYLAIA